MPRHSHLALRERPSHARSGRESASPHPPKPYLQPLRHHTSRRMPDRHTTSSPPPLETVPLGAAIARRLRRPAALRRPVTRAEEKRRPRRRLAARDGRPERRGVGGGGLGFPVRSGECRSRQTYSLLWHCSMVHLAQPQPQQLRHTFSYSDKFANMDVLVPYR